MPADAPQDNSEIRWTWSSRGQGWLSTTIRSDGVILQGRQFSPASDPLYEKVGKLSADEAGRIRDLAITAFASEAPAASDATSAEPPPHVEVYDLHLTQDAGARSARVVRGELARHPAMKALQQAIIRARHRAAGGYLAWTNVGARVALVAILLLIGLSWLIVSSMRNLSRMQREALHTDATVTERHGTGGFDKYKYIMVHLTPPGAAKPVDAKIADSLSAENWKASNPGATVRVWYHPVTGKTYLEDDILRNGRDENGLIFIPLGITLCMLPIIWFVSRFRAGIYPDGKEFLVNGDRVALDGKALPFSDSQLYAVRALIRLAS